jgi:hypothetical protein
VRPKQRPTTAEARGWNTTATSRWETLQAIDRAFGNQVDLVDPHAKGSRHYSFGNGEGGIERED